MKIKSFLSAGLLLLLALTPCAHAWDATGHMLVVRVAQDQLPAPIRKAVEADLAKFNERMSTHFDLVCAACWMDDIRSRTQLYGTWHYLDVPLHGGDKIDPKTLPEPNGLWLARNCLDTLSGKPPFSQAHDGQLIDRPLALVMLLHIEGDLHQPLHTVGNDDRGGNEVTITNLIEPVKTRSLHHLWDSGYRRQMQGTAIGYAYEPPYQSHLPWAVLHGLAEPWVADQASAWELKYAPAAGWEVGTPETWLKEGWNISTKLAYGKLPGGMDAKEAILSKEYLAEVETVTRQRIVLAGFRLAEILKKAYAADAEAPANSTATPPSVVTPAAPAAAPVPLKAPEAPSPTVAPGAAK